MEGICLNPYGGGTHTPPSRRRNSSGHARQTLRYPFQATAPGPWSTLSRAETRKPDEEAGAPSLVGRKRGRETDFGGGRSNKHPAPDPTAASPAATDVARSEGSSLLTPSVPETALGKLGPALTSRLPLPYSGGSSTLTFLVGHSEPASRGNPGVERCKRSLNARGLYCFLRPLREGRLAHLRANISQSDRVCDLSKRALSAPPPRLPKPTSSDCERRG
ncbi:hypothetical protein P7K49_015904 [Saguinus oedipus]|uniref:Uncharacterized protein n=1 Tax=Saguinus oedipus TaxID=9490 RepID=A0ABQ9VB48_SAGOE|nr:hypothetical protein P7K49_015904 [Saguinus oedipus]